MRVRHALIGFNPRRDLFLFATVPGPLPTDADEGFNPRRDLFLFATAPIQQLTNRGTQFQSQAGFVPLCDQDLRIRNGSRTIVSIPGGICSSLRPCSAICILP